MQLVKADKRSSLSLQIKSRPEMMIVLAVLFPLTSNTAVALAADNVTMLSATTDIVL
jgi:hypothetical protein